MTRSLQDDTLIAAVTGMLSTTLRDDGGCTSNALPQMITEEKLIIFNV